MLWSDFVFASAGGMESIPGYKTSRCTHCTQPAFWRRLKGPSGSYGVMVYPSLVKKGPAPHVDTPADVAKDYEEARSIAGQSPRGAAALLRLCIQKLCSELGEDASNLNGAIGALVRKGLPVEIQQALDVVRVIGNNAVHPGQIADSDVAEVADELFGLINFIVEDRIARPKRIQALFDKLPQGAKDAIAKRDSPPSRE